MQLLDIADASPAIKSRAQKLTDDLIRRMGEYSQKNKRK
jgi:hypothetical protein